jgi:hypothetical protein
MTSVAGNNLFVPDETALDLYRRCKLPAFTFLMSTAASSSSSSSSSGCSGKKTEVFQFGDILEIQCHNSYVPDLILDLCFQYFEAYLSSGVLIHVSTGNNMLLSLVHSRLDVNATILGVPMAENRLLSAVTLHITQLIALFEAIVQDGSNPPTLIVLECLVPVLLSMKDCSGKLLGSGALVNRLFESIKRSTIQKNVIVIWINSGTF